MFLPEIHGGASLSKQADYNDGDGFDDDCGGFIGYDGKPSAYPGTDSQPDPASGGDPDDEGLFDESIGYELFIFDVTTEIFAYDYGNAS